jgi:hypothetical protein
MTDFVNFSFERGLLLNLLIDGIEGYTCRRGQGWGQVEEYHWSDWYSQEDSKEVPNPALTEETVLCKIRDVETASSPFVPVTLKKLQDAINWVITYYPKAIESWEVKAGVVVDLDYDADSADLVLQRIILGDVIYG